MILRILLYWNLFYVLAQGEIRKSTVCLTGHMTDVQTWVDGKGILTSTVDHQSSIDLSASNNPIPILHQKMAMYRSNPQRHLKYLSLARCRLTKVPQIFHVLDANGRHICQTIEYLTFFGNKFVDVSSPGDDYDVTLNATQVRETIVVVGYQTDANAVWSNGFKNIEFQMLKELDLRACSIQVLSGNIFQGMPKLESLYIGGNEIAFIDTNAFAGLNSLIHLDFTQNEVYDEKGNIQSLMTETFYVFEKLVNLKSLDLSFTKLSQRHQSMIRLLGKQLTRLSLCETGLTSLDDNVFNGTSLRILDLSGNNGVLTRQNVLGGLENHLQILHASDSGVRSLDIFNNFRYLEVLHLPNNEITHLNSNVVKTLVNLQILNLEKNRITSWFDRTYSYMPELKFLSLRDNNINVISEEMIEDLADVAYVGLSGNFLICNCHARDFLDLAARNEINHKVYTLKGRNEIESEFPAVNFHKAFTDVNEIIQERNIVNCTDCLSSDKDDRDLKGNFLLFDYYPLSYVCLLATESKPLQFHEVPVCKSPRDIDYNTIMIRGRNKLLALLVLPCILLPLAIGFIFRRNFRYCCITMRNSAMLSLINKNEVVDDGKIFNYDVFVSYCNEDRDWVLDHLLPHLEKDCSISACLHERDFQVGYSILENIVSCMDRSKSIMLIISQRFLLSQWCQFEMHLAQHRLLETRREDLTLVLLEEIPRRFRPTTLHYLMLTKTYIVWPKNESERPLFWRRLQKSLFTIKLKHCENVSWA